MLVFARMILLCVIAPWLITFLDVVWGHGIMAMPLALAVGLAGLWWTPFPRPLMLAASIIYVPVAAAAMFGYSLSIICDYRECERLPDGTPAP